MGTYTRIISTDQNVPASFDTLEGFKVYNLETPSPYSGTSVIAHFGGTDNTGSYRAFQLRMFNQNASGNLGKIHYRVAWGNSGWSAWRSITTAALG